MDLRRPAYGTMGKKLVLCIGLVLIQAGDKWMEDGGDFGAGKTHRKGSLASRGGSVSTVPESSV